MKIHLMSFFAIAAFAITAAETAPKDLNVTVFGSSTVWGTGLLDEQSLTGTLDDRLRDRWSTSVLPEAMKFTPAPPAMVESRKFFHGKAARINGKGAAVEFELDGDTLAIWQAILPGPDYGIAGIYADGEKIGEINNRHPACGHDRREFTGDGKTRVFPLGRPFTRQHQLTLDGVAANVKIYNLDYVAGSVGARFPGFDALVVRIAPAKKVEHFLYFFKAPAAGVRIAVDFDYGSIIGYTGCTVGEDGPGTKLESCYGLGNVAFDPANPTGFSAGLDFRSSNRAALFVHRFDHAAKRKFKIILEDGVNPYFIINFASNRAHLIQNAGIGGFTAKRFLTDTYGRNIRDSLDIFVPDIALIVLGGNDDWMEMERLVSRTQSGLSADQVKKIPAMMCASVEADGDDTFKVTRNSALIDEVTPTSLTSTALVNNPAIEAGNFVRLGDYHGDIRSTVVRVIRSFDPAKGKISWNEPLNASEILGIDSLDDLVGAEFTVRTLGNYRRNLISMIDILRKRNPRITILLLNTYTPNYFMRDIWGYAEVMSEISAAYPDGQVIARDATPAIFRYHEQQLSGQSSCEITSTGSDDYDLPWDKHWQGFKVLIDGVDVYGKNCYIRSGWYYAPSLKTDGSYQVGRTNNEVREPMKLVFTENPPPPGKKIRVVRADRVWSGDFAHPDTASCRVIGDVAFEALEHFHADRTSLANGAGSLPTP
ncbi:MAG: hypothetical protein AB7F32_05265 [Victivallaceae bacterium]